MASNDFSADGPTCNFPTVESGYTKGCEKVCAPGKRCGDTTHKGDPGEILNLVAQMPAASPTIEEELPELPDGLDLSSFDHEVSLLLDPTFSAMDAEMDNLANEVKAQQILDLITDFRASAAPQMLAVSMPAASAVSRPDGTVSGAVIEPVPGVFVAVYLAVASDGETTKSAMAPISQHPLASEAIAAVEQHRTVVEALQRVMVRVAGPFEGGTATLPALRKAAEGAVAWRGSPLGSQLGHREWEEVLTAVEDAPAYRALGADEIGGLVEDLGWSPEQVALSSTGRVLGALVRAKLGLTPQDAELMQRRQQELERLASDLAEAGKSAALAEAAWSQRSHRPTFSVTDADATEKWNALVDWTRLTAGVSSNHALPAIVDEKATWPAIAAAAAALRPHEGQDAPVSQMRSDFSADISELRGWVTRQDVVDLASFAHKVGYPKTAAVTVRKMTAYLVGSLSSSKRWKARRDEVVGKSS
jgi:hypothetical protein